MRPLNTHIIQSFHSSRLTQIARLQSRPQFRCASSIPPQRRIANVYHQTSRAQRAIIDVRVQPNSLRDTLTAHRKANEEGGSEKTAHGQHDDGSKTLMKKINRAVHGPIVSGVKHLDGLPPIRGFAGQCPPINTEWRLIDNLPRRLSLPWMVQLEQSRDTSFDVSAQQQLTQEIAACERYFSPSPMEDAAARQVYKLVQERILPLLKTQPVIVSLVGSRTTGLQGPLSDLDINLTPHTSDGFEGNRSDALRILGLLYKQLRYSPPTKSALSPNSAISARLFLNKISVPIIECFHAASGLDIQIQCTKSGHETTRLAQAFLAEFPTLPALFKIVRHMLHMRGLTDGGNGGITSYPLLVLIATSIRLAKSAHEDVGQHLLQFLDFFSGIDFASTAIMYAPLQNQTAEKIATGRCGFDPIALQPHLTKRKVNESSRDLMSLQDPADWENDLGKSASCIKHVQATFIEAGQRIREAMAAWDARYDRGLDMRRHGSSILSWCLGGDYSYFEERRLQLKKFSVALF